MTTREPPIVIVSMAREQGITGVHTHVYQLREFLERSHVAASQVTPHSWAEGAVLRRLCIAALFGVRPLLERVYDPAHVWWYHRSHEWFLRRALQARLAKLGPCVIYAQCPPSARAALSARSGPHQRVILAVHFRVSQADEWADKAQIARGGRIYRGIRKKEAETIPRVDGLVFVSSWALQALHEWMPAAEAVPQVVIHNFVRVTTQAAPPLPRGDLVTIGNLQVVKNHRYLLHVLAAARDRGFRYTLDVFGEGVERRNLIALAQELGLERQVRLRGFRRDAPTLLSGYRLYVHASYSESSSLAIMEAMGAGLPVVSSDAGALPELFDDPEQGRFWPLDDPEHGADILIAFLEGEGELRRAGRAALEKFRRDYDADRVAPRLVEFLRNASVAPGNDRVCDQPGARDLREVRTAHAIREPCRTNQVSSTQADHQEQTQGGLR